jgi:hypothetical protein
MNCKGTRLAFALVVAMPFGIVGGQAAHPDSARIHSGEIAAFWRAVDRAAGKDTAALVAALRDGYLASPSPGLTDWIFSRLMSRDAVMKEIATKGWDQARALRAFQGPATSPERSAFDSVVMPVARQSAATNLARKYLARRQYYDGIRANTLAVDTARGVKDSVRAAFQRLEAIYPEASYADVYFLIGRMNSGGTTSGPRLLIGTEIFARDSATPIGELNAWERAVTGEIRHLPHIVAHEFAHTLQGSRRGSRPLLAAALGEGSADFIAELISGSHIINPAYAYGDAHEQELWTEFKSAMDGEDTSNWLYEGDRATGRPADLGYWMGYRIARAYYERATDKRAAVKEILEFRDPKGFLAASGYGKP